MPPQTLRVEMGRAFPRRLPRGPTVSRRGRYLFGELPEGDSMAVTSRDMSCSPAEVFKVLSDGWLLALWVVGASRIRDVDKTWPAPGSEAHHSVGTWPLLINDTTTVQKFVPDESMLLRARGWPVGEADVLITAAARPGGCRVTITEDASKGPARLIPKPVRAPLLNWRNVESLRRLAFLAERAVADQG